MTNLYTGAHKQKTGFNVLFIIVSTAFIQFWVLFTRVLSTYKLELVYSALFVSASGFLYARLHLSHHSASFSSEMKSWLELMRCLTTTIALTEYQWALTKLPERSPVATDESHSRICQPIRQSIYSRSNLSVIQNFELNQLVHWKRLIFGVSEQTFFSIEFAVIDHIPSQTLFEIDGDNSKTFETGSDYHSVTYT